MNLRSLLVYLDHSDSCDARTHVAIRLARERGCHLVGLAPTGVIEGPSAFDETPAAAEYTALAWDALRDQAERVAQRFRDECHAEGIKSFETVVDESSLAPSIVGHAHCSDLTLLSQAKPETPAHRLTQDMVEQVVLYSARPTLVIPHSGRFTHTGQRVLVAWDDSREASRAVADALPLLCHANTVHLVQWNEPGAPVNQKLRPRLEAFKRWMMWHGVTAESYTETTSVDIASALISRAASIDADLIVMGAYGHSRWTERILGGATRGLLKAMSVPVLMSH